MWFDEEVEPAASAFLPGAATGSDWAAEPPLASTLAPYPMTGADQGTFDPMAAPHPLAAAYMPLENEEDNQRVIDRMMDRHKAMSELRSKFEIVTDESQVDGNRVTMQQFMQAANLYSDIRMGATNFEFNEELQGDALAEYKDNAMIDIGRILQTESGRALVSQIASAKDADGKDLTTTLGAAEKKQVDGLGEVELPETSAVDPSAMSDGRGTSAVVEYNPLEWVHDPRASGYDEDNRSDVSLYHELVHAHHMHQGKVIPKNLTVSQGSDRGYALEEHKTIGLDMYSRKPNRDEFFENRYRHERAMIGVGYSAVDTPTGMVWGDQDMAQRTRYHFTGPGYDVPFTYAG